MKTNMVKGGVLLYRYLPCFVRPPLQRRLWLGSLCLEPSQECTGHFWFSSKQNSSMKKKTVRHYTERNQGINTLTTSGASLCTRIRSKRGLKFLSEAACKREISHSNQLSSKPFTRNPHHDFPEILIFSNPS